MKYTEGKIGDDSPFGQYLKYLQDKEREAQREALKQKWREDSPSFAEVFWWKLTQSKAFLFLTVLAGTWLFGVTRKE